MKLSKCKRAASVDNFYIAISFFGLALFLLIALVLWNGLTSTEMNTNFWDKTPEGGSARDSAGVVYGNLDNIGIIAYFALHLGILVMAFLLRTHPVVYIAAILLTAILVLVAVPLSNTYETVITSNADLVIAAADLPKVNFIMAHFPTFEVIWAFLTAIITFGLAKGENLI